mmetsp:Transcript_47727/g.91220  ORF Transcript_47727/g.91220 Transcript_47727/m.91220 type:complete len:429 (-) Transcript_47727:338-1624(-)|eukprot:CAMPEP_0114225468 /NCGR_PEP_ID=MMETSP0058-20121206/685_1 /TAXON_ID=36894 /ORGANISM="Pyramimonas parkeae, CCMP726" /LENGTH=428 /DNA_ID=CAMNT_0001336069 /DNA_START=31 /DNA_END=1317 /DNA_ORIENTATION=+
MTPFQIPRKVMAVIGSGPTGLHAAVRFAQLGCQVIVLEQASHIAAHVAQWAHVQMFSPWEYNYDPKVVELLESAKMYTEEEASPSTQQGISPTGAEYVSQYLSKMARWLEQQECAEVRLQTTVKSVVREGLIKKDDLAGKDRQHRRFLLRVLHPESGESFVEADYVIDASGSYGNPCYAGPGGSPALGETSLPKGRVHYHIPAVHGADEAQYKNAHVLVVGAGFSSITSIKKILELREKHPETRVTWLTRAPSNPFTVLEADVLPQRKELSQFGNTITTHPTPGVTHISQLQIQSMKEVNTPEGTKVEVHMISLQDSSPKTLLVDRVVSNVGYKPDCSIFSELHVHQCWATDGPIKLAASLMAAGGGGGDCLSQVAPGPELLKTEEPGFYILGMKSYGRSSLFIIKIGLEQIDQIAGVLEPELTRCIV